jgi:RNA polymerase sigma-70 factor (ECF subfamily)
VSRQDEDALTLFLAQRGALIDYASGITGSRAQAEDVVQEAWLRFAAAAGRAFIDNPPAYLWRVVRNLALDGRRSRLREGRYRTADTAAMSIPESRPSPEAEALHRDALRLVFAAMAELPQRTRTALEMHRLEGCTLREIAGRLGISTTQAHELVAVGLDHCRRRLREGS